MRVRTLAIALGLLAVPVLAARAADRPTRLELDLADARFVIRTVSGDGEVGIDGSAAKLPYKVKRSAREERGGVLQETIRCSGTKSRRKGPDGKDDGWTYDLDTIQVTIPRDRTLDLDLVVHRGESDIDLGDLTLSAARIELLSGDHELTFGAPVRRDLDHVELRASRGEFTLRGLANLRARELRFRGSAGSWELEFDGKWPAEIRPVVSVQASMGDLVVKLPAGVALLDDSSSSAFMGESAKDDLQEALKTRTDSGPGVLLKMRMTMGSSSLERF